MIHVYKCSVIINGFQFLVSVVNSYWLQLKQLFLSHVTIALTHLCWQSNPIAVDLKKKNCSHKPKTVNFCLFLNHDSASIHLSWVELRLSLSLSLSYGYSGGITGYSEHKTATKKRILLIKYLIWCLNPIKVVNYIHV